MEIALIIIAALLLIVGILGCVIPGLPGPPLSFVGLLCLQWAGIEMGVTPLIIWGVATVIVTVIDFLLTPWMTKRFGGSKAGNWGAIIGLLVGFLLPFPFGPLVCPFAGAFIGEWVFNRSKSSTATKAAFGAFLSFFVGTGIKLLVSTGMIVHSIMAVIECLN